MKIGIFGGSFNPIHIGHEKIVYFVLEKMNLDKLIVVPVGIPSHRENTLKDSKFRYELCKKVFEEDKRVEVCDIEIKIDTTSYTIDTLIAIREKYGEENEYYEIVGEDSIKYFDKWKDYQKILELSKVVVLKRKNVEMNDGIKNKNIIFLDNPFYEISSTIIREKIKNSEDISGLVNEKIKDIILKEMI